MITKTETSMVSVTVYCDSNKGKTVKSRWGGVAFDEAGYGEMSLPKEDLKLLDQLNWLLPEDRKTLFPTPEEIKAAADAAKPVPRMKKVRRKPKKKAD